MCKRRQIPWMGNFFWPLHDSPIEGIQINTMLHAFHFWNRTKGSAQWRKQRKRQIYYLVTSVRIFLLGLCFLGYLNRRVLWIIFCCASYALSYLVMWMLDGGQRGSWGMRLCFRLGTASFSLLMHDAQYNRCTALCVCELYFIMRKQKQTGLKV